MFDQRSAGIRRRGGSAWVTRAPLPSPDLGGLHAARTQTETWIQDGFGLDPQQAPGCNSALSFIPAKKGPESAAGSGTAVRSAASKRATPHNQRPLGTLTAGRITFLAAAILMLLSAVCIAQDIAGKRVGRVQDNTGAVVPGATVTARNTQTGVSTVSTTGADGGFRFESLHVGNYQISVQHLL